VARGLLNSDFMLGSPSTRTLTLNAEIMVTAPLAARLPTPRGRIVPCSSGSADPAGFRWALRSED
jgi:hypothetical protein